ncbi:hypothetical protein DPMN_107909 [Dreissena polymorpha]|uniref:Uncharacterized protein n=1 Tax=Dreissena polymorpha TaxID=45954 RepID=A0A9D4K7V5_DREPO|nr:hypothetical protein DPMN_107909 [Dreissena polymorpha]
MLIPKPGKHLCCMKQLQLRRRIEKGEGLLKEEYYSPEELSPENQIKLIDPLLLCFINWLSSKSELDNGTDANEQTVSQKVISIASDITYLVNPSVITPKHLGLTVYLYHTFGAKKLIEQ